MTPEEFARRAQEIYDKYKGDAGEEGHSDIDELLSDCLHTLGYDKGLDILWSMKNIWYA